MTNSYRPSAIRDMRYAIHAFVVLLAVILFVPGLATVRQAWQWNTLSVAVLRWVMTPDAAEAQRWEAQTAAYTADAIKISSVWSPEQRERLQALESMLARPSPEPSGLQIVTQVLADVGTEAVPESESRSLLNRLADAKPMFPMGATVEPGWRLLGFDLLSHRLRPTEQEPILLYWERDPNISTSPGSLRVDGWRLLWNGRQVYQLGIITKLVSQVGIGRSLPVGTRNQVSLVGPNDYWIPVDEGGRYIVSIRMRVLGDPDALGCFRVFLQGSDQAVDPQPFCTGDPKWTQATFVFDPQVWPGEWKDMHPYIWRRTDRPPGEVQYDNALLFSLDTEVLTTVPSR